MAIMMPNDWKINIAIMWLAENPRIGEEAKACLDVAEWLQQQMTERTVRDLETITRFDWQRETNNRGRHYLVTRAGKYEVVYKPNGATGRKFVGRLNYKPLSGVVGSDVDTVKRLIEERITAARRIARAED